MRSPLCYLGLAYKGLQPTRKRHVHPIGGGRALPLDPTLRLSSPHYQRYASVTTTAFILARCFVDMCLSHPRLTVDGRVSVCPRDCLAPRL